MKKTEAKPSAWKLAAWIVALAMLAGIASPLSVLSLAAPSPDMQEAVDLFLAWYQIRETHNRIEMEVNDCVSRWLQEPTEENKRIAYTRIDDGVATLTGLDYPTRELPPGARDALRQNDILPSNYEGMVTSELFSVAEAITRLGYSRSIINITIFFYEGLWSEWEGHYAEKENYHRAICELSFYEINGLFCETDEATQAYVRQAMWTYVPLIASLELPWETDVEAITNKTTIAANSANYAMERMEAILQKREAEVNQYEHVSEFHIMYAEILYVADLKNTAFEMAMETLDDFLDDFLAGKLSPAPTIAALEFAEEYLRRPRTFREWDADKWTETYQEFLADELSAAPIAMLELAEEHLRRGPVLPEWDAVKPFDDIAAYPEQLAGYLPILKDLVQRAPASVEMLHTIAGLLKPYHQARVNHFTGLVSTYLLEESTYPDDFLRLLTDPLSAYAGVEDPWMLDMEKLIARQTEREAELADITGLLDQVIADYNTELIQYAPVLAFYNECAELLYAAALQNTAFESGMEGLDAFLAGELSAEATIASLDLAEEELCRALDLQGWDDAWPFDSIAAFPEQLAGFISILRSLVQQAPASEEMLRAFADLLRPYHQTVVQQYTGRVSLYLLADAAYPYDFIRVMTGPLSTYSDVEDPWMLDVYELSAHQDENGEELMDIIGRLRQVIANYNAD